MVFYGLRVLLNILLKVLAFDLNFGVLVLLIIMALWCLRVLTIILLWVGIFLVKIGELKVVCIFAVLLRFLIIMGSFLS